jgi:hypothetical protein
MPGVPQTAAAGHGGKPSLSKRAKNAAQQAMDLRSIVTQSREKLKESGDQRERPAGNVQQN